MSSLLIKMIFSSMTWPGVSGGLQLTVHVDVLEPQGVLEGGQTEGSAHEGGGLCDLGADLDDVMGLGDLEISSGDLDRDVELMEKIDFSGVDTGGSLGQEDVTGGDGSDLGRHRDDIGLDEFSQLGVGVVGEDESHVQLDEGEELLKFRHVRKSLSLGHVGVVLLGLVGDPVEGLVDQRVLSDDDGAGVVGTSQLLSGSLDLLGGHVVQRHNDHVLVGLEAVAQVGNDVDLSLGNLGH